MKFQIELSGKAGEIKSFQKLFGFERDIP